MNKFLGIAVIIMALAIAVVPAFTDCQSQGMSLTTTTGKLVPMKCHWTGIAEIGIAVPLLTMGVLLTTNRRRSNLGNLGIIGIVLGGMVIAYPNGLIGVCATPTMLCHTIMKPALTILGSFTILGSIGILVLNRKAKD